MSSCLKISLFQGSTRVNGPPNPPRVGGRVVKWMQSTLVARGHEVTVIDPIDIDLPLLRKPHFAYAKGRAPEVLDSLAKTIEKSHAFMFVSPEVGESL